MLQLDYNNPQPLYEQIKEKIKEMIFRGLLPTHQQLPSVRELAAMLTVNPNTIQKAYRDLENQGYLYSVRGKGNFVAASTQDHIAAQVEILLKEVIGPIQKLRILNVTLETIQQRVAGAYEDKNLLGQAGHDHYEGGRP